MDINQKLVDHLFREFSGQMISTLTRFMGPENLELAENAVSDAMMKALSTWPYQGVPENPKAWLFRVSKNYAIDELRKKSLHNEKAKHIEDELDERYELSDEDPDLKPILMDDRLKMIFLCCHPLLKEREQMAMALKIALGLGVREISKAFLIPVKTIEQRLVRAKKKLREAQVEFELPAKDEIVERLESVYSTLYLLFNEGYSATEGESLTIKDLCMDAIKFLSYVLTVDEFNTPKGRALLALFYFQASRLEARISETGEIILLEDQDREKWNQNYIINGMNLLMSSAEGDELSIYHLEASIASVHSMAKSFDETDWDKIISDYDILYKLSTNPIHLLNKAVGILMKGDLKESLQVLLSLKENKYMSEYHYYFCALGEVYSKLGELEESKKSYSKALSLAKTTPEKDFINKKLQLS